MENGAKKLMDFWYGKDGEMYRQKIEKAYLVGLRFVHPAVQFIDAQPDRRIPSPRFEDSIRVPQNRPCD
jgi:hypothetical protein